jgi:hypothetical protein
MPYVAIAVVVILMVINGVFALSEMAVVNSMGFPFKTAT